REMCIVAILCSMKYESQLYSHINGAFRLKNSSQEIKTIIVSLQQIAGRSVSDFGLEVFNSFLKTKNGKNS
ncbi:MAG: hypothetical protein WB779_03320, partial [Ignavibacteriaceae bacterium]